MAWNEEKEDYSQVNYLPHYFQIGFNENGHRTNFIIFFF